MTLAAEEWLWISRSWRRFRVSSRNSRSGAGGTMLPRNRPCSRSWAIHSQSFTSVFRPGTLLTVLLVNAAHDMNGRMISAARRSADVRAHRDFEQHASVGSPAIGIRSFLRFAEPLEDDDDSCAWHGSAAQRVGVRRISRSCLDVSTSAIPSTAPASEDVMNCRCSRRVISSDTAGRRRPPRRPAWTANRRSSDSYLASGSGRSWNFSTLLVDPFPPSP